MKDKVKKLYIESSLATKIRISYFVLLVPVIIFLFISFFNLWNSNRKYEDIIQSAVVASDFSLDFKKDFDYETYLLIVGNKTIEESSLDDLLGEANRVVENLEKLTDSPDNSKRLKSAGKYLKNLERYKTRIEENLAEGNNYETNMQIWENDVQIVTELLRETIFQFIYYEIRDIQQAREEYQLFYMKIVKYLLISFVGIIILIVLLSYFIPQSITRPIRKLSKVTNQVAKGDLTVRAEDTIGSEMRVLSHSFNAMIDKINELLDQVTKEQVRLRKAELELLQAQINPHFLYNTLDTIVWLAEAGDQKKVVSMVGSLSEFFRTSLNQGRDIITIEEELKHVRSYLEIQQVRYQDILEYEIRVPQELYIYSIPKITIQPLVENALYHGIKNKRGLGKITVGAESFEDHFVIYIEDNGIGIGQERLKQVHDKIHHKQELEDDIFGLYNVNERITLKFGEEYGLKIDSVYMEGTTVKIILPFEIATS